jgi:hypothetical protein
MEKGGKITAYLPTSEPNSLSTYFAVELWRHTKNRISLTLQKKKKKKIKKKKKKKK